MNGIGAAYLVIAAILILTLPRRIAILPLLLSAAYMTSGQVLEIASVNFTIPRLLVAVGFLRVMVRGEHVANGMHTVDKLLLTWAAILLATSAFHTSDTWIYRSGIVWTELGCYFLFRIFMQDLHEVRQTFRFMCVAMLPLAALMLVEKASGQNPFASLLGGVNLVALMRDGHLRASGPFAHPILAGTVGAICIGIALAVGKSFKWSVLTGLVAGTGIVFASTSTGPVLVAGFIVVGMAAWVIRHRMRVLRWAVATGLLTLAAIMNDPVYFLMARVDITGGSQGYYRAQLIRSSIAHLSEWWATGTDYTRHWMATGIYANDRHADMTNHILAMGVMGGLPLLVVFVAILAYSFRDVGRALSHHATAPIGDQFFVWLLGALLFGLLMNFFTISMFDQSVIFFYLVLAAIQCVVHQEARVGNQYLATSVPISPVQRSSWR